MKYGIFECSARAKTLINPKVDADKLTPSTAGEPTKYGLEVLKIGQAISVPVDDVKENSLRVYVAKQSKKLERKFSVLTHAEAKVYEVARIG